MRVFLHSGGPPGPEGRAALRRFLGPAGPVAVVNPHYKETDPAMAPWSETRDDRIREYHAVRGNAVLGLEEGSLVLVEDGRVTAAGTARVRLFRPGAPPAWFAPGEAIPLG